MINCLEGNTSETGYMGAKRTCARKKRDEVSICPYINSKGRLNRLPLHLSEIIEDLLMQK